MKECIICYSNTEETLSCGHCVHLECAKKQFKPECPLCRKVLNIKVTGTRPEVYIPVASLPTETQNIDSSTFFYIHRFNLNLSTSSPCVGNVIEEEYDEEEYDEENPFGDEYNYDSENL